jgi:histone H4
MDPSVEKFLMTYSQPTEVAAPKKRHKGTGQSGAKSLRKKNKTVCNKISDSSIRKLARRGGVKRISGLVYELTRDILKKFVTNVLRDTVLYTESAKRNTVSAMDVVMALRKQGRFLYGFE